MFENLVNNKDCRNRCMASSSIQRQVANFEKRLQLPGFNPVRDIYLIAIVMLMFSSLKLTKSKSDYCAGRIISVQIYLFKLQTACHYSRD